MAKQFLIYTNRQKDKGLAVTERIRSYLEKRGRKVLLKTEGADWSETAD